jgi:hypothetical protein
MDATLEFLRERLLRLPILSLQHRETIACMFAQMPKTVLYFAPSTSTIIQPEC